LTSQGRVTGFEAGGIQAMPQQVCYSVTNGAISGVSVLDTSLSSPSIGYKAVIATSAGMPLYSLSQPIYPFGATWNLDTWAPTQSANITTPSLAYSVNAPQGRCSAPAIAYTGAAVYTCQAQIWVALPSGGSAQVPADWNAVSGLAAILNKPTLGTAAATNACGSALTSTTDLCVTSAPFTASTAGSTTTTTSATFAVGTSGSVASCSTFQAGNGVLITGAGASAANYIGTVVSCSGTTLTVTPATSTSVASGGVVQHDETAAINAAVTALASTGGTIYYPDGTYLVNGPLQHPTGANAAIIMPSIQYQVSTSPITITMKGLTLPGSLGGSAGAQIRSNLPAGNLIGGRFFGSDGTTPPYSFPTSSAIPPFTYVWLDIEDMTFRTYSNPGLVVVNAQAIAALQMHHVWIDTNGSFAITNTAGAGVLMPEVGNNNSIILDDVAVLGYYTDIGTIGEHAVLRHVSVDHGHDCYVFDTGNFYPGAGVGSTTVENISAAHCTNAISTGTQPAFINIEQVDLDPSNTTQIFDPSNLLFGWMNYKIGSQSSSGTLTMNGGGNLTLHNSWVPSSNVDQMGTVNATAINTLSLADLNPALAPGAQQAVAVGKLSLPNNAMFEVWRNTTTPNGALETYAMGSPIRLGGSPIGLEGGNVYVGNSTSTTAATPPSGGGLFNVGPSNNFQVDNAGHSRQVSVGLSVFTVATLPSASTIGSGAMVVVSDATTFTPGTCTGGGSDVMIAVSNGTSWTCH
jgi:hypothetical protein